MAVGPGTYSVASGIPYPPLAGKRGRKIKLEKVQIAGGGIAGLSAGVALRRAGIEVEIHERFGELQTRATGFSIWAFAIEHLVEWGFDPGRLNAIGREIVESHFVDGSDRPLMTLQIQEASQAVGAPSMDVDRRRLQEEMIDLLGAEHYHLNSEVTGVERDGEAVALVLADGTRRPGDLVLGGDGIHSIMRDQVLDQTVELKQSRYDVIEGIATLDERHLPRGHHKQVWGPHARFGAGWVSDERARWFLGGRGIALADDPPLSKEDLLAKVDGMPAIVPAVVEGTEEDQIVRTAVRHGFPPKRWHDDRLVLLGDAAHTLSPFAAMGACSTIEDVAHLVELLGSSESLADTLGTFQNDREGDVKRIEKTGRRNEQMMMPTNALLYWARNELLGHTPDAKLLEIAEGMTTGEG